MESAVEVTEYPGVLVSRNGTVYNKTSKKVMSQRLCNGYNTVRLGNRMYLVHRLLACAFIPKPADLPAKPVVNHINEDKLDNRLENLEWCVQLHNVRACTKKTSHERRVHQLDAKTKEVIKTFDSIPEAAEAIGKSRRAIQLVLSGKNPTAGGFKWKYEDESNAREEEVDFEVESKEVENFPNYLVLKDGRIFNTTNMRYLKPVKNDNGNVYVTLSSPEGKKNFYVQRIVAFAFLPHATEREMRLVHHIDGNKENNHVDNLRWAGAKESI